MLLVKRGAEWVSQVLEPGMPAAESLLQFPGSLNLNTISAGVVSGIFSCTGPVLIIVNSAVQGHLSTLQLTSWIFAVYFFGGLISLFLSLYYRQPLVGAFSIPGAAMVGASLAQVGFAQALGAYFFSGFALLLLGFSGLISKVMRLLPQPIVMAMIAGTLVRFGTGIITSTQRAPALGFATLAGYFIFQRLSNRVPPIFGALGAGLAVVWLQGIPSVGLWTGFVWPHLFRPVFVPSSLLSISFPLVVLVLGSENAQAIGVLRAEGYPAPVNMITVMSGAAGMLASFFGAHTVNMAGVSTAICAGPGHGPKERRYVGAVVTGIIFMVFGLMSGGAVAMIKALPTDFINIVAGLSMFGVLARAFGEAFSGGAFRLSALFSYLIAVSGISIFHISAPFWALVGGIILNLITLREDTEA